MKNFKECVGILFCFFFFWMNNLMNIGNKWVLEYSDFYLFLDEDRCKGLMEKLE